MDSKIYRVLKPCKVMGWLIGDQWVKRKFTPVGFKIYQMLDEHFEPIDIICIARRGQSSHTALWHYRAQKFNFFLRGFKYLLLFQKTKKRLAIPLGKEKIQWKKYK